MLSANSNQVHVLITGFLIWLLLMLMLYNLCYSLCVDSMQSSLLIPSSYPFALLFFVSNTLVPLLEFIVLCHKDLALRLPFAFDYTGRIATYPPVVSNLLVLCRAFHRNQHFVS